MSKTRINELEVHSWNPFTGCTKISPACSNCYAERLALKLNKWGTAGYENKFQFAIHDERLDKADPLKRKKPSLYFINNMSDTFHEDADEKSIDRIMDIVKQANWHNYYILTKRSQRMRKYFEKNEVPNNLWLGVTVEDKKHGFPRLKDLQQIDCKKKHICCEPLLEDLEGINLDQIRIVFGGGESGNNARKTELSWVLSLQNQCKIQNTHFFWKQWGNYGEDGKYKGNGKTGYLINGEVAQSFPDDFMP